MKNYYNETMENAEQYYKNADYNHTAKMIDGGGFTTRIDTSECPYFVTTRIDEGAEVVVMEIEPLIHCNKETRSQVSEYIAKINPTFKCGNIRISENGSIIAHTEQRFNDSPLSADMFRIMEVESLKILDIFSEPIDKLAHSRLIEPDEANVEKMIILNMKKVKERFERVSDLISEDDDDDFSDSDCPVPIPTSPGFLAFLRRKAIHGDSFASTLLDRINNSEGSTIDIPTDFESDDDFADDFICEMINDPDMVTE